MVFSIQWVVFGASDLGLGLEASAPGSFDVETRDMATRPATHRKAYDYRLPLGPQGLLAGLGVVFSPRIALYFA